MPKCGIDIEHAKAELAKFCPTTNGKIPKVTDISPWVDAKTGSPEEMSLMGYILTYELVDAPKPPEAA